MTRAGALRPNPRAVSSRRRAVSATVRERISSDTGKRQIDRRVVGEQNLIDGRVGHGGSGNPARQIVLPHPLESCVVFGGVEMADVLLKPFEPAGDGMAVVTNDVLDVEGQQPVAFETAGNLGQPRLVRAWKDVRLNERIVIVARRVAPDRVHYPEAAGRQASGDALEVARVQPPRYVLEHADADDAIEGPGDRAEITQPD